MNERKGEEQKQQQKKHWPINQIRIRCHLADFLFYIHHCKINIYRFPEGMIKKSKIKCKYLFKALNPNKYHLKSMAMDHQIAIEEKKKETNPVVSPKAIIHTDKRRDCHPV